ncbi:GPP34 family phosphoprotein [Streptomyces sp. NPDC058914]|uniref:GPP34 family phosphoprotein n=1 Tax=Streptomyces TaxID=1883 RepID=UPI00369273CA
MTTAQDLAIVALGAAAHRSLEQGDLSLALAGAEMLDPIQARALVVEGDRILPSAPTPTGERLSDEAALRQRGRARTPRSTTSDAVSRGCAGQRAPSRARQLFHRGVSRCGLL